MRPASARNRFNSPSSACSWRRSEPICSRSSPACWLSCWSSCCTSRMRSSTPLSLEISLIALSILSAAFLVFREQLPQFGNPKPLNLVEPFDYLAAFGFGEVNVPFFGGTVGGRRVPERFPYVAHPLAEHDHLVFRERRLNDRLFGSRPARMRSSFSRVWFLLASHCERLISPRMLLATRSRSLSPARAMPGPN